MEGGLADAGKNVIRSTDWQAVRLAKTLIRTARFGALATLDPVTGAPLASRVATATDHDGAPLILISDLSAHTGALNADPRCSLLVGEPGKGDPLAHPRISLSCRAVRPDPDATDGRNARRRYLNRHPKAQLYAGFGDFHFFRIVPVSASLNGGFGRAYLLDRPDLMTENDANAQLAASEQAAIDHMNADHADAIDIYARAFAGKPAGNWRMTGIDADGIDLAKGDEVARVFFPQPLESDEDIRKVLVSLANNGRNILYT